MRVSSYYELRQLQRNLYSLWIYLSLTHLEKILAHPIPFFFTNYRFLLRALPE